MLLILLDDAKDQWHKKWKVVLINADDSLCSQMQVFMQYNGQLFSMPSVGLEGLVEFVTDVRKSY